MKYLEFKKVMIRLLIVSNLCVMLYVVPTFTVFGQETATANELTVMSIALRDLSNFANSKIIGKDGEKEIVIEDTRKGFEAGISVQKVDIDTDENGIREQGGSNVLIAQLEYGSKPFVIKLEVGIKLKYKLVDGNAVILFDESYCFPLNELKADKPADFDASLYADITLKELGTWENTNSGEIGKFKATVHFIDDAMARLLLRAQDDYFFSDAPRGLRSVEAIQFKSKNKWAGIKDGQKVSVYFNAISKGGDSYSGRIIEYIEIIE